jgi:hypothetical protein
MRTDATDAERLLWRELRAGRLFADQDGAEVVDVGARRAGEDEVAERGEEAVAVVVGQERARRRRPKRRGARQGVGASIAPALSSVPSMPSVSPARAWMPGARRGPRPAPAGIRRCGRRARRPRTVTVVSPPDSSTQGGAAAAGRGRTCSAMPAMTGATSRASPSMASPRMSGVTPAARAASAAASSASCGVAMRRVSQCAKRGSPGLGVSLAGGASTPRGARRLDAVALRGWPARRRTCVGSATVGPEAMSAGSSPARRRWPA